jgi:3-dehydroquinate synthetase
LLKRTGLPTDIPRDLSPGAMALAMQADKKSADGKVRTVCLEEIGRTTFVPLSAEEIVSRL